MVKHRLSMECNPHKLCLAKSIHSASLSFWCAHVLETAAPSIISFHLLKRVYLKILLSYDRCFESEICKMRVFRIDLHIHELLRCLG